MNEAAMWQKRIQEGQRSALSAYGHLSVDKLRELGRTGKVRWPVIYYVIAATAGRRRASEPEG